MPKDAPYIPLEDSTDGKLYYYIPLYYEDKNEELASNKEELENMMLNLR